MVKTTFLFRSLCVGAFLIAISEQSEVHLYPLTYTGPTPTKPIRKYETNPIYGAILDSYESAAKLDWEKSRIFRMGLRLVDANEDASYPVMVKIEDEYYPLCEDDFNDLTAQTLCEMYHYERGYRTTYTLADDQEFSYTNLECYQIQWTEATFDEDFYPHYLRNGIQKCKLRDYGDRNSTGVFPCAKNQAAAVHCFDLRRSITWQPRTHNSQVGDKSWSITFTLDLFKLGKKVSHFGKGGVKDQVAPREFVAVSCGKRSTPSLKYPKSHRYFELTGKFRRNCEECVDLYFLNHVDLAFLYFWTVCKEE